MCVCVQLPRADRALRFSFKNVSKRLDYLVVVCRGAVPAFCRCCHLTGRYGEIRPNRGVIDECHLRVHSKVYSAYSYKRGMCVGFWRIMQLMCVWLVWTDASSTWTSYRLLDSQTQQCGSEFEESMPNTRTQTTSRKLLLQTYICATDLATWAVGPDVCGKGGFCTEVLTHSPLQSYI